MDAQIRKKKNFVRLHPDDLAQIIAQITEAIRTEFAPIFAQVQAQARAQTTTPAADNSEGDPLDQICTLKRAAEIIGVPYSTLSKLSMDNKLPYCRLNKNARTKRYIPRKLLNYMESNDDLPPLAKKRGTVSRYHKDSNPKNSNPFEKLQQLRKATAGV